MIPLRSGWILIIPVRGLPFYLFEYRLLSLRPCAGVQRVKRIAYLSMEITSRTLQMNGEGDEAFKRIIRRNSSAPNLQNWSIGKQRSAYCSSEEGHCRTSASIRPRSVRRRILESSIADANSSSETTGIPASRRSWSAGEGGA